MGVQIRLKGHETVVKNFPLFFDSPAERKRQLAEAEAWHTETRRRMLAGSHVSSREAELTSLGDALRRYEADGMTGKEANRRIERYRIETIPLLIRFAVATTLRRGRVLSCRLSDIRDIGFGKRAIAFERASAERNKRTGIVPVSAELRTIIKAACALRGVDPTHPLDEMIFAISESKLASWWQRLLSASRIVDLHWHDLRHEGTSKLFESGLSTAEVMSITGHSTQEMVDRYSHYSAALVLDKLERGNNAIAIAAEVGFLIDQYLAAGGDIKQILGIIEKAQSANHKGSAP